MKLPEFSVNRRVTVTMLTVLVVILGIVAFLMLGFEMLPDLDYPTISIVTYYPGASSQDVEEVVTKPLETAIAGVKNIKNIQSESIENISLILVEFVWGTNLDFAAQDLRDAIDMSLDYLPEDSERPMVVKFNLAEMPVIYFGVTGMSNTFELKKILEDEVEPKLKHLDGVASIMMMGGDEPEKKIIIDKVKLEQNGISIDEVVQIIGAQNLNMSAGYVDEGISEFMIRSLGEYTSIDEIANTPISITQSGQTIYVKDIAEVVDGFKEVRYHVRTNHKPTVMLWISKESGANTLKVSKRVKTELERIKKVIPPDIDFVEIFDQGEIVSRITSKTGNTVIYGGILAIIIMFLFLRNWRPTLIISLAIPISIIATFIPIYLAKFTLNIMTLGGLALGVGMLVDNSIVVIENIYRHLEKGMKRFEAAKLGASQVGMAITASTLTTIAVFAPMIFAGGFTGQLIRGLALTVAFALFASLFVALTIVPMLASIIFKKRASGEEYKQATGGLFKKLRNFYLRVLEWVLHHRGKTIVVTLAFFVLAIVLIPFMGAEFMPKSDMPMQVMTIRAPVGTSLDQTSKLVGNIENIILVIPEVIDVMSATGAMTEGMAAADPTNPQGSNEAQIFFRLKFKEERDLTADQVKDLIRSKLPPLENVEVKFMDMSGEMMGGSSAPISIKIYGKDLDYLRRLSKEIEDKITVIPGIVDVQNSYRQAKPELHISINRDKAFQYGLTTAQIESTIRTATYGTVAGIFRQSGEEIDILVRYDKENRNSIKDLENITITSPMGFTIPLKQVATWEIGEGPLTISHEHQTRKVTITANLSGTDLQSSVQQIKAELKDITENLPLGYFIEYGGAYEDMQESFVTLFYALLLAALLVYVILASQFESFRQPFVIMFTLPLAYIGVIYILVATGTTLNVISFVGLIVLSGIVVNNGIVLIDHINQLRREGLDKKKSITQACSDRMRPVLITAITTIGGMFPMAISTGQGAEMRAPLAIAVIGGLITATFFTLLIIPMIYSLIERISFKKKSE
ncbi:MAG TPA: efflux RND transporter permease subunit [Candidatus Cloacimonetes bacterium]|nr:efflux RND transporter permease subunit [Candidatus Cloacimonadota bacterium]HEX37263.1 efflux RND transporter permease subunit [Candidatus Cloacimonadota bacterium]